MNRETFFFCGTVGTLFIILFFCIFYLIRDVLFAILCLVGALIFAGIMIGIIKFWDYVSEKLYGEDEENESK